MFKFVIFNVLIIWITLNIDSFNSKFLRKSWIFIMCFDLFFLCKSCLQKDPTTLAIKIYMLLFIYMISFQKMVWYYLHIRKHLCNISKTDFFLCQVIFWKKKEEDVMNNGILKQKKVHVIFIDRQYWMGCIIVLVDLNMILSKKCKKDW